MNPSKEITVYTVLCVKTLCCDLGHKHDVQVYGEKHLRLSTRRRLNQRSGGILDYGDTEYANPIYVDAQGRDWNVYISVDYSSNVHYVGPNNTRATRTKPQGIRYDQFKEEEKP
jgi:hypothetical protein